MKEFSMAKSKFNLEIIKTTIDSTLKAIDEGKNQMFFIMDGAKKERNAISQEEKQIKHDVIQIIEEVDKIDRDYKKSRVKLIEASKNFNNINEKIIKEAYNYANSLQIALAVAKEKEQVLKKRRDEFVRRLKMIEETVVVAENAFTQFGTVSSYLTGDLKNIDDIVKTAEQKIQFGIRIMQTQEEERLRIAREIHDGPAQTMASVLLRTEIVGRIALQDINKFEEELIDFKKIVRQSLVEIRGIIYDLRPMALDDLGLIPALEKYIEVYKEHNRLLVSLILIGKTDRNMRLSSTMEIALFRIIQECLNNIKKHSKATNVKIKIEFLLHKITLVVEDDGIGFIVNEDLFKNKNNFGLLGMQERLSLLDGSLNIISTIGNGTKIIAVVSI
jgi:two-component system sensor histidine kinase DegS